MTECCKTSPAREKATHTVSYAMVEDLANEIQATRDQCDKQDDAVPMPISQKPVAADKTVEEKTLVDRDVEAWEDPAGRVLWLLSGARPDVLDWKQGELQAVLARKVRVTEAVIGQIMNMDKFDVSDYMLGGNSMYHAVDMSLAAQMEVMVDVVMTVVENCSNGATNVDRVSTLRHAFQRGLDTVRDHARKNALVIRAEKNRARIRSLVNRDLEVWSVEMSRICSAVTWEKGFPLNDDRLPPVPVPTWDNLDASIDTVGLLTEEERAGFIRRNKRRRTASKRPAD